MGIEFSCECSEEGMRNLNADMNGITFYDLDTKFKKDRFVDFIREKLSGFDKLCRGDICEYKEHKEIKEPCSITKSNCFRKTNIEKFVVVI